MDTLFSRNLHNSAHKTYIFGCYYIGTAKAVSYTHLDVYKRQGFGAAMVSCVIPFLPGDAVKIVAGALLVQKLRPMIPIR